LVDVDFCSCVITEGW